MQMRARHRAKPVGRDVEGNDRRPAAVLRHGGGSYRRARHHIIEAGHAFRQIVAEAADVADRERLDRGIHGEVSMADAVDPAHGHDRARAGAVERHRQFRLPPELRQ